MRIGPRKIAALVGAIVLLAASVVSHRVAGDTGLLVLMSILQIAIMLVILEARVALRRHVDLRVHESARAASMLERLGSDIERDLTNLKGDFIGRLSDERKFTDQGLRQLHQGITSHTDATLRDQYQQVEALLALYHDIQPKEAFPPLRNWVASPDLLYYLYRWIIDNRPSRILELGSGVSTVTMAYALQRVGQGRIVSLEHDEHFRYVTATQLEQHGLSEWVDVRLAPLERIEVDGETYLWYSTDALPRGTVDLVLVDGPPGDTQSKARYPALPLTHSLLSKEAVVILDDYGREDEREIATRWAERYPDLTLRVVRHEKGTAILEAGG